jgi:SAM-dependent methyltransferase
MPDSTWEQAVQWLREQPDRESLVRTCYYGDPLVDAAERFSESNEWIATRHLLGNRIGCALDIGAGRGISSYALAKDGWLVTAIEPDQGEIVGAPAIRALAQETNLTINVVEETAEQLPFDDNTFDLVYAREVLHHVADLPLVCEQACRVLKPHGMFIAVREHVISKKSDLHSFLSNHPLHALYGGENAFLLDEYLAAFMQAGFRNTRVIGPFDSPTNFFPLTKDEWRARCAKPLMSILGYRLTLRIANEKHVVGRWVLERLSRRLSQMDDTPGRLYSFVMRKEAG